MHTALDAFFHHCAGNFIRRVHIAREVVIVCAAASAANEFCKTIIALFPCKKTVFGKLISDTAIFYAVFDVAQKKIFVACKLMAGINIAVRHNRKIFVARSAGGNSFLKAGSALQIDIEMEEIEALALEMLFKILFTQIFLFTANRIDMLLLYSKVVDFCNDELH